MTRVTYVNKHIADKIHSASELVIETSQDFKDLAYMSHDHDHMTICLFLGSDRNG